MQLFIYPLALAQTLGYGSISRTPVPYLPLSVRVPMKTLLMLLALALTPVAVSAQTVDVSGVQVTRVMNCRANATGCLVQLRYNTHNDRGQATTADVVVRLLDPTNDHQRSQVAPNGQNTLYNVGRILTTAKTFDGLGMASFSITKPEAIGRVEKDGSNVVYFNVCPRSNVGQCSMLGVVVSP